MDFVNAQLGQTFEPFADGDDTLSDAVAVFVVVAGMSHDNCSDFMTFSHHARCRTAATDFDIIEVGAYK
jgi:hypothetical protein